MGAYSAVATTTAHTPAEAGGATSQAAVGPPSGPQAAAATSAGGRLTTPARLWVALIAAVVAFLAVGGACATTLAARQASETRAADSSEKLVQNVNELYHALAEADATAATALLVGPVSPPELTSQYAGDINQAVAALSTASRELAGDDKASRQLADVSSQLPLYTAYIATAQANNRFRYPLAGAYLSEASRLMGDLLQKVQTVANEESDAQRSAQADVSGFPTAIIVVGVLAALVLVPVGRELSRSTRRRLNAGILAGVLIALVVAVWSLAATSSASSSANRAQADFDRVTAMLSDRDSVARTVSFQSLTLVERGQDGGDDLRGQRSAFQEIKVSQLDAQAKAAYGQLKADLDQVQQAVRNGDYHGAVKLVVGDGTQNSAKTANARTVNADASALDDELVQTFKADQSKYTADANAAGSALSGGLWGGLIGGVLAALAAAYGINRRLAEYR